MKEKTYLIYCHINKINGYRYIGQTSQKIMDRWRNGKGYIPHSKNINKLGFYQAILDYGWDNFEHIILEDNLSEDKINEKEEYWIAYYHTYVKDPKCKGYNLTKGGSFTYQTALSVSSYSLDGELLKTYKSVEEASYDINIAKQNIYYACIHPWRTCNGCQWKYENDNRIITQMEKPYPGNKKISIKQYSLSGEYLATFESIADACDAINANNGKEIKRCCEKEILQSKGYIWRYADDNDIVEAYDSKKAHNHTGKKVAQYDLNGNYITTYSNQKEAAVAVGMKETSNSAIARVCKGTQKTAGGYKWKWV